MASLSQMKHQPSPQPDGFVDTAPMLAHIVAEIENQLLIAIRISRESRGAFWPATTDERALALRLAQTAVASINPDRNRTARLAMHNKANELYLKAATSAKADDETHSQHHLSEQAVDRVISYLRLSDLPLQLLAAQQEVLMGGAA